MNINSLNNKPEECISCVQDFTKIENRNHKGLNVTICCITTVDDNVRQRIARPYVKRVTVLEKDKNRTLCYAQKQNSIANETQHLY